MQDTSRLHPHHGDEGGTDPPLEGRTRAIALGVLCFSALTTGIDATITNVALPFISTELGAGTNGLQWVIDAYSVSLAGLLVLGGALADRYGRRLVFLAGYTLFGLGCLLAAFAPSTEVLIGARALMGAGAAGVISPALAIIAVLYPPEQRARAIGMFVVMGAIGLAVGPVAGGLLLDHLWWGSVFLVNVPLVAIAVGLGSMVIPESRKPVTVPIAVGSALMSVVGLAALMFAVIEGPNRGWLSPLVLAAAVVGVVVVWAWVRLQLRRENPMFDVRVLTRPVVAIGSATLFVAYWIFFSLMFILPQYLQDVADESIVAVGFLLVPFAGTFGLLSMQASRIIDKVGARVGISVGLVVSAAGYVVLAAAVDAPLWVTIAGSAVIGAGLSQLIAPPSTVVMNGLPPEKAGEGSSLNMVSRFVGGSVGVAVVGSVLAARYRAGLGDLSGLSAAQEADVEGSVSGAVEVAGSIGGNAGTALKATAGDAFDSGAAAGYLVVAVVALAAAALAWRLLPDRDAPAAGG